MIDPLTRLSELPSAEPSPERAARLRIRCRAQLAGQARRADRRTTRSRGLGAAPVWQTALASLCVMYVVEVIVLTAEVLRSR